MRPVQVYLAMRKRSLNLNSRKAAIAFAYPRDLGNPEAAIEFRQVQTCIHIAFVEKSENSSRRPWHVILTNRDRQSASARNRRQLNEKGSNPTVQS